MLHRWVRSAEDEDENENERLMWVVLRFWRIHAQLGMLYKIRFSKKYEKKDIFREKSSKEALEVFLAQG